MKLSEKGPSRCFPAVLLNKNSITLFLPVNLFEHFKKILNSYLPKLLKSLTEWKRRNKKSFDLLFLFQIWESNTNDWNSSENLMPFKKHLKVNFAKAFQVTFLEWPLQVKHRQSCRLFHKVCFYVLLIPLLENQVFSLFKKGWNVTTIVKCNQITTPNNIN